MEKTLIKQRLNELSNQKGLSKNNLAKKLGVSSATLSNIENEHWERLNDDMLLRIWNMIKVKEWNLIETYNFQKIINTCDLARERSRMIGVIGYTGAGKTTALKRYYNNHENTYYISCKKSMSAKQFLISIAQDMGISTSGTVYEIMMRIIKKFNKQNKPLLIIDESGKCPQKIMSYIHDIRNDTEGNLGVVLSGVEYFKTNLETAVTRNKEGMPEFYDRVSAWETLEKPRKDEIVMICKENYIDDEEVISQFLRVKNFRILSNYIQNIQLQYTS
ncbi:MAG: AAA family ATPase [Flavobacteriales bacterium]